jgi:uncharacterized YigZ family protein
LQEYVTVSGESTAEYSEKHSRFIANCFLCESEQQASEIIATIKTKYWDARHNVYAYLLQNGAARFSDDGEPHGTAGKPMFDVLSGSGITDIAVVVTRYFGGILLGTGGLVRAYSKSVQDCLSAATVYKMIPSTVFTINCDYTDHGRLVNLISSYEGNIDNTDFTDKVTVRFSLREEVAEEFLNLMQAIASEA